MSEFMVNTDMFGMYVRIPTGYSREMHIYKVVSKFKTNSYCDVPIVYGSKPVPHEKEFHSLSDLEDVLNVIHCGIDETEVIRVALKDCEIITPTADVVPKSEVEELIKSVDDMLDLVCAMTGLELTYFGKYAELKKKYTEGRYEQREVETDTNVSHKKYFTPEDVRKMTREEVKVNYSAILDSMKKWN